MNNYIVIAINFFLLFGIFTILIYTKNSHSKDQSDILALSFLKGFGFAILASFLLWIVDWFSGGIATKVVFFVYPLVILSTIILSLWNPKFLCDIDDNQNTSLYRYWSLSFWIFYSFILLFAIGCYIFISILGRKISNVATEMISRITTSPSFSKLLNSVNVNDILSAF